MREGFLSRFEHRRDWSNRGFFDRGNQPGSAHNQDTLLAGFVVYFGPSLSGLSSRKRKHNRSLTVTARQQQYRTGRVGE